jgi:hypothetical protein
MSLIYSYQPLPIPTPIVSLGGRATRPRALIPISVVGPAGTYVKDGLLDTGADDTVFEEWVAAKLGIDLTHAPQHTSSGVGLVPAIVRFAQVTLRLAQGTELREWRAWVGFTTARLRQPLLGFAGVLQFFDAHFFGAREVVELTVNSLYPGT